MKKDSGDNEFQYVDKIRHNSAKKVFIYGAGNYGMVLLDVCIKNAIKINGFCVRDSSKNRDNINGIPVVDFLSIKERDEDVLILIAAKGNSDHEISDFIKTNGRKNYIQFPKWIENYDKLNIRRYNSPIIEVTPTIGCRIQCKYCPQTGLLRQYYAADKNRENKMSLEAYKRMLGKLPEDCIIDFSGFVEPFQNPEAIDMMEFTYKMGHESTLFTTLRGVDIDTAKRIVCIPFTMVIIHIADEEGFSKIPVTDEYLSVLKFIVNSKYDDGTPFVRSASCHGSIHPKIKGIIKGKLTVAGQMMDRAGNLEDEEGHLISNKIDGRIRCSRSKKINHNVLLPDGTIVLCCNDYGMMHVLGNLNSQSYEQIMNGQAFKELEIKMSGYDNGELLCKQCIYAVKDETD